MNFLLDATLGMLVIWLAVKLVSRLVEYKQWTLLMFGEYGTAFSFFSFPPLLNQNISELSCCSSDFHHTGVPQTHYWRCRGRAASISSCSPRPGSLPSSFTQGSTPCRLFLSFLCSCVPSYPDSKLSKLIPRADSVTNEPRVYNKRSRQATQRSLVLCCL